jgi:hypothetical protein
MRIRRGVIRAGLRGCRPLFASRRISVGGKRRLYEAGFGGTPGRRGRDDQRVIAAAAACFFPGPTSAPAMKHAKWQARTEGKPLPNVKLIGS